MMRLLWRGYTSTVFFLHSYTWIAPTFLSLLFASGGTASNATVKAEEMGATSTSTSGTSSLEGLVVLGGSLVNFETISPFGIVGSELECWKVIHDSVHSMPPPSDEPLAGQVAYEQAEQYFMDGDYRLAGLYYLNALAWSNKNNDAYTFETCFIKFISSFDRLEDPAEGIMYLARIYLQSNHSNEARLYGMSLLQVALNINAMNEDARDLMEEFNIDCKLNDKFFSFECSQDGLQVTGSIGNKSQNFMDDKLRMKIVSDFREQIPEYLSPSECMNLNDKCGFWAEKGECTKNPVFMLEHCRLACGGCEYYREKRGEAFGCPQSFSGSVEETEEILTLLKDTYAYIEEVKLSHPDKKISSSWCWNAYPHCTFWATRGECERNPNLYKMCSPACKSCERI